MPTWKNLQGTLETTFSIGKGKATLVATGLTTARTLTLPDATGTAALVFKAPFATSIQRAIDAGERVATLDVGTPTDGATLCDTAFAKLSTECDSGSARYFYLPNWKTNYRVSAPITFTNPGVRIFGDQGATYNRNDIKTGWIEAATGTVRIFNLGNSRTTGNPADNWTVDGISLRQASGVTARTIDGIAFTSRMNGPDRGATIRSASFVGLKDAITIENPDLQTNLACLDIQSCVFHLCDSAVNAKGSLLGLRFVGNQCEQNIGTNGIIRGSIDGGIIIDDNMFEGQSNCISIDIPPTFGNMPQMRSAGNYFETNIGAYVYRLRVQYPDAYFSIGPNYTVDIQANDYVLVKDSLGSMYLDVHDNYPVAFDNAQTTIKYGSDILRNAMRSYRMRKVGTKPTEVIIADYANLTDDGGDHVHAAPLAGTLTQTPMGELLCAGDSEFVDIPSLTVAIGDMVCLNILCRVDEVSAGNLVMQVWSQSMVKVFEWEQSRLGAELNGKWALVSVAFVAQAAATSLRFDIWAASGTYVIAIAGVAAKNYGAHVNDSTVYKSIVPVTPLLTSAAAVFGTASGVMFRAYRATTAQTLTTGVAAKVQLNAEDYDFAGIFDSTTNYRCQPTLAGYYHFIFKSLLQSTTAVGTIGFAALYKNGAELVRGAQLSTPGGSEFAFFGSSGSELVYLNGTTDYVELWSSLTAASGTLNVFQGTTHTYLSGRLVRGDIAAASVVQTVASAATVTPTFLNDLVTVTAQAVGLTLANLTGAASEGRGIAIRVKDNGTARTIAYGSQYRPIGVTLPTTTVASKTLYLGGIWNATDTKLDIVAVDQEV